jgi:hypothetical protein
LQIGYKKLSNFIIKKYKLKFKKKTKYYKRRHFKSIKSYGKLKNKVFNRYIKDWTVLYNSHIFGKKFLKFNSKLKQAYNRRNQEFFFKFKNNKRNQKLLKKYKTNIAKLKVYAKKLNEA